MKILFDFDNESLSGGYSIRKGLKYIVFGVLKIFGREKLIKSVYEEVNEYALTVCRLNRMIGIETIVGVKEEIYDSKMFLVEELKKYADVRVHRHHLVSGENRKRYWFPPLNYPKHLWHFEDELISGNEIKLGDDEIAGFYFDYPYHFKHYIDYIYSMETLFPKSRAMIPEA